MRARAIPPKSGSGPVGHDGHSPTPLFADKHTDAEWEQYLDQRRIGVTPDLAARLIGSTATRMRHYMNREPCRKAEAEAAAVEGDDHYRERLRGAARVMALDTDNPNARILEVELATHVPGYEHLRRDRVKHEGHITHGIVIDLDPERLDALPAERLHLLREVLAELDGEIIDADEVRELPAA